MKKSLFPSLKKSSPKRVFLSASFLALSVGLVWSFLAYKDAEQQIYLLSSQEGRQEVAQQETSLLLANLAKLIILPEGEEPLIATIQDVDALAAEQEFYKDAQNGDKLIVYSEKALIYNEESGRIVNVGPVFRTPNDSEATVEAEKSSNESVNDNDSEATVEAEESPSGDSPNESVNDEE